MSQPDCVTDPSHDRHGASTDDRHTGLNDSHDRQRTRVGIGESDGPWPVAADRTCSSAKFPGDMESEEAAVDLLHRWRCRAGSSGTDCAGVLQQWEKAQAAVRRGWGGCAPRIIACAPSGSSTACPENSMFGGKTWKIGVTWRHGPVTLRLCIMMKNTVCFWAACPALRSPRLAEPLDLVVSMNGEARDRNFAASRPTGGGGGVISNALAFRILRFLEMTNHVSVVQFEAAVPEHVGWPCPGPAHCC